MMAGLQAAKKDLRKRMRDIVQNIPAESIVNQSRIVASRLFALPEYQSAKRIGVYLSMPTGELSTTNVVQNALAHGKEVFVPYIHSVEASSTQAKMSVMDMLALDSMEEFMSLERDKWGIPSLSQAQVFSKRNCFGDIGIYPKGTREATAEFYGLDLIVMPGMAFDTEFRRLGHGKGYYDSFLARYSKWKANGTDTTPKMPLLVALSLQEQTLFPPEEIPVTNHDWPVDILIVGDERYFVRQQTVI